MPPNLEENPFEPQGPILFLFPLSNNLNVDFNPDEVSLSDSDSSGDDVNAIPAKILIPLEQNLRELLVKVTSTEDLNTVTQVKLRVIARDVTLQHLGVYVPGLRELVLDGSVVSTLRDLGCGLKNLKILKVNRCDLNCLDGMLGFEGLEELYAANNSIEDPTPCAFLSNVRVIDLGWNCLKDASRKLAFLSICENLEHVRLEGNDEIWQFPKYRQTVKSLLPALKTLDGITFNGGEGDGEVSDELSRIHDRNPEGSIKKKALINGSNSPRNRPLTPEMPSGFTVSFPPKVFPDKPLTSCNQRQYADQKIAPGDCTEVHRPPSPPAGTFIWGNREEGNNEVKPAREQN